MRRSLVVQRQIGAHADSYATALREDPDDIVVGEMRDLDTIGQALAAAETGHLVLATLHTNSAAKTVDRIIDAFPAEQQAPIRSMLAGTLRAVVAQQLLRTADGKGRVAVQEILLVNPGVAGLIREGKTAQIPSSITMGSQEGMQSFDQHRVRLMGEGRISAATAFARCTSPSSLEAAGLTPDA